MKFAQWCAQCELAQKSEKLKYNLQSEAAMNGETPMPEFIDQVRENKPKTLVYSYEDRIFTELFRLFFKL
jgi:hypothetical protein